MTENAGGADTRRPRRRRGTGVLIVGGILSLSGAVIVGVLGASGAGSLAAALVGLSVTSGVAGLVSLVGAALDEYRGTRAPRRDVATGAVLLLAAPILLVLAGGAAAAA